MLVVSLFYIGSATRRWWPAGPQKFMVLYHIPWYFTLKKRNPNFRSISRRMTSRYDGRVWFQNYFHSQHPWLSTNYFKYLQVPLPHLSHPPILWLPPPCSPVGIFTSNLESVTNFLERLALETSSIPHRISLFVVWPTCSLFCTAIWPPWRHASACLTLLEYHHLILFPVLPLEKGRRVLGTRLATSCPLLAAGVCKYPKRLFPASRRFFYHVVMCSYWIVLYHNR